jgi:hypothetical protein
MMSGPWCIDEPCLFYDGHAHVEVAYSWIATLLDSYVAFIFRALEALTAW